PSGWRASFTPNFCCIAPNSGCVSSGVAQSLTGPSLAAQAVATVRSISRACRLAAPSAPSAGMSRVLANPGIGALARIEMFVVSAIARYITIAAGEHGRFGPEEIGKPQPPHQEHRADDAVPLPAPSRGGDRSGEAERAAEPFEALRQRNVLHQQDVRKSARSHEGRASDEHGLVSGDD